jgi:predicted O-linked N-acetylglucosamine transferase (SPINDLY family)
MDPRIPTAARLQQQKNYAAAEPIYRQILKNQPREPDALLLLGLLLHETGRHVEAIESLKKAAVAAPGRAEVHQTLVGALVAAGRLPEAIAQAREVVRLRPLAAASHYAVGQLLLQSGDLAAALPYARRASELENRSILFLLTLSRVHSGLGSTADAIAALDRALAIDPQHADALVDKAQLLHTAGQIDAAINLFEFALRFAPSNAAAHNSLGSCYLLKQRTDDAIRCFESAATLLPTSPKPRNNVGAVLKEQARIDEAIEQFQRALEIDPAYADAHCNLGGCYAIVAEHQRAIDAFAKAVELSPEMAGVGSNLLLATLSPADWSPQRVFDQHRAWGDRHTVKEPLPPVHGDRSPDRRLRIGYISPDFREHSVRYFIEPILAHHDRSQVQVHCYASGSRRDSVSDQLAKLSGNWHSITELSDRQLAQTIRGHDIDILIDLAGHTADNRLPMFAFKPAPVQVTYLGYPTTSGMNCIDYRITDAICDPPGSELYYTEQLLRLPDAFFVYSDDPGKPFDPTLPADRNGVFTFGSFNSYTKINESTLVSWANILLRVPNSRLFMKAKPLANPNTRKRVLDFFQARGVAADRIELCPWVTLAEHIELLGSRIDLMLDTFPYNGHTTTCQAMWMGVPTVTCAGETFRARVGKTIVDRLGLPDFVAENREQYEQAAIGLATDLNRLREIRPTLRDRFAKSSLCDAATFTRHLEAAYRAMWQNYCRS